jgi:ComF family protein
LTFVIPLIVYQKIKNFILDTLFPINCITCGYDNFWLCNECLQKITISDFQICPSCERFITDQGKLCPNCKSRARKEPFHLNALVAATKYNENNISKLIHSYKYNFVRDLSAPLGEILVKSLLKSDLPLPNFIVPVPLHPRRLRWRGFNQAELLANFVSQKLTPGFEIPVINDLLIRKKYSSPQMKIKNYSERKSNIQNSFAINQKSLETVKGKKILLVDDVATTASTLLECAKILKINGASKVFAVVVARQEIKRKKLKE